MELTILVALDESPWAQAAVETALKLASCSPQTVRLVGVHVVNVTQLTGSLVKDLAGMLGWEPVVVPKKVEASYRARGERLLGAFAERCAAAGVEVRTVLETGAVVDRLAHHAGTADLIVVGGRGETELAYPGQGGGNLERLVRRAPTTVLITPRSPLSFSGITIGYDGSDGAQVALRVTRKLAVFIGCPVRVCYVADGRRAEGFDPTDAALAHLTEHGVEATVVRLNGVPHEALPVLTAEAGHDLLALGYRGRSLLGGFFLGRVTERLLGALDIGVIVAR
ncbi:MAG: universal stress protein [Alphaproteobacteria bacterium]|nr:universal stress protein [Alphaproteobacteria bacterium]